MSLSSTGESAAATVSGSPYAIVASGAIGSGLENYTISYVNGSLTVNPAPLTITANNMTKTYGQTVTLTEPRVHQPAAAQWRLGVQREPEQHGRVGDRDREWLALRD